MNKKQDSYICSLQKTHFRTKDTYRLKVKGWEKIFNGNGNEEKIVGLAILISDQIDFKTETIIKDKEVLYIIIKG